MLLAHRPRLYGRVFRSLLGYGCLASALSLGACSSKEGEQSAPKAAAQTTTPNVAPEFNRALIPLQGLAALEALSRNDSLLSDSSCRPVQSQVATGLHGLADDLTNLEKARTASAVTASLREVSRRLSALERTVRSEGESMTESGDVATQEVDRLVEELAAAFADFSESFRLSADAVRSNASEAAQRVSARIENGVSNTQLTLERLAEHCQ